MEAECGGWPRYDEAAERQTARELAFTKLLRQVDEGGALQHLALPCMALGDRQVAVLVDLLARNTRVVSINLAANGLTRTGAESVAQMLAANDALTALDLRANGGVGDAGAAAVAAALRENRSLTRLGLESTGLGPGAGGAIGDMLGENTHLTSLAVGRNGELGAEGAAAIVAALAGPCRTVFDLGMEASGVPERLLARARALLVYPWRYRGGYRTTEAERELAAELADREAAARVLRAELAQAELVRKKKEEAEAAQDDDGERGAEEKDGGAGR